MGALGDNDKIVGICLEMCPVDERILRQRERLLHRLEMYDNEFDSRGRLYKVDSSKAIKCFSRPAAGVCSCGPEKLRPGPVLVKTVHYLVEKIVPLIDRNSIDVYDFVTDRFRAVRQDMTIQRLDPEECLKIVCPMIRFHVLFGYILCENKKFEFQLNLKHLEECILKSFECFSLLPKSDPHERTLIESIYTCLNINRPEIVLNKITKFDGKHINVLKAIIVKNYVRFFELALDLDLFSKSALAIHIPRIRKCSALFAFCQAFSSANSSYPLRKIERILSYNSTDDVLSECRQLGIRCSDEFCHFNKKELVKPPDHVEVTHWWGIEKDLKFINLPQIILKL